MLQAEELLEAREVLVEMSTADYPSMKKESRDKKHRALYKMAFPDEQKEMSLKDFSMILAGKVRNG